MKSIRKQSKHVECQPARLKKNEQAIQNILLSLDEFKCDLFDSTNPTLRSIQFGIKATEKVALDFNDALPKDKIQVDIFLDQRIFSKKLKINDRLPKNKRLTFDNNKISKKGDKAISQAQMEGAGLASVIELLRQKKPDIFKNRVTEECLSIFNVDGSFRRTAKCKLLENMNLQPTTDKPEVYYSLTDMSMLFRLATSTIEDREKKKRDGSAYKWIDYIRKIASMVHTRHPLAVQCYAINDDYEKQYTIKDDEHDRRAGDYPEAGNKFPKHSDKFPGPKEFNSFMSDYGNKARLQALVCQFLENREDSHKIIYVNNGEASIFRTGEIDQNLRFNHPEADTTIFGIYAKLSMEI